MRAWYFDNLPGAPGLPHNSPPSKPVTSEGLATLNVRCLSIPVDGYEAKINDIAREREYKSRDTIDISRAGLGEAYDAKIKGFFQEHMHEDEEIRYVLSGGGYFDVREAPTDAWIRLALEPGDLLVLPAGIYHRLALDDAESIHLLRLFQDEPKWTAYNRGPDTEVNPQRVGYLRSVGVGA
ncbi:RmlC-like cupin domain-containing protein [Mycena galericulata]|nr:RmlC-like cupin domain-containing protein [Mycena galericulata]